MRTAGPEPVPTAASARPHGLPVSCRENQPVSVKEEPRSPEADVCPALEVESLPVDTPLSPTTFINSILQDEIPLTACTSAASPTTGTPQPQ